MHRFVFMIYVKWSRPYANVDGDYVHHIITHQFTNWIF